MALRDIVLEIPCSFSLLNVRVPPGAPGRSKAGCLLHKELLLGYVLVKPCGIEVLMGEEAPVTRAGFSWQEGGLFWEATLPTSSCSPCFSAAASSG